MAVCILQLNLTVVLFHTFLQHSFSIPLYSLNIFSLTLKLLLPLFQHESLVQNAFQIFHSRNFIENRCVSPGLTFLRIFIKQFDHWTVTIIAFLNQRNRIGRLHLSPHFFFTFILPNYKSRV